MMTLLYFNNRSVCQNLKTVTKSGGASDENVQIEVPLTASTTG